MATAQKAADSNVTSIDEARPKPKKKLLLLVLAAVMLLAGGGGAAWWLLQPKAAEPHAAKPAPPAPPVFVELETFTVNIAADHVLQTGITLQVKGAEDADQLKLYMPQVKSRLLLLLSARDIDTLRSPDGKVALASDIATALRAPYASGLAAPAISGVFLTSFVIQ
jgi:flagellar FliL protein